MKHKLKRGSMAHHILEIYTERAELKGTALESKVYDDYMDTVIAGYKRQNPQQYELYLSYVQSMNRKQTITKILEDLENNQTL